MPHKQINELAPVNRAECSECGSRRMRISRGTLSCDDCGEVFGKMMNKYGAKRTQAQDGLVRDSKYEASVADELLTRKRARDIKDYDSQFKVECVAFNQNGKPAFTIKHKVDFRIHHNDGSYELLEAKGVETSDYRWRRKCLEELWLPFNKDHTYTVIKQRVRRR